MFVIDIHISHIELWQTYLTDIQERHPVLGSRVARVWSLLQDSMVPPQAGPDEDVWAILIWHPHLKVWSLVWDSGQHHFEIDVEADLLFWFYRDRVTEEHYGGETTIECLLDATRDVRDKFVA